MHILLLKYIPNVKTPVVCTELDRILFISLLCCNQKILLFNIFFLEKKMPWQKNVPNKNIIIKNIGNLSIYLSFYLSIYLPICLSVCLPVFLNGSYQNISFRQNVLILKFGGDNKLKSNQISSEYLIYFLLNTR